MSVSLPALARLRANIENWLRGGAVAAVTTADPRALTLTVDCGERHGPNE